MNTDIEVTSLVYIIRNVWLSLSLFFRLLYQGKNENPIFIFSSAE
jgi:hypothetical protein